MTTQLPLVVDVEAALLQSDLRLETFWARHAGLAGPDPAYLPLRNAVCKRIAEEHGAGRPVLLLTEDAELGGALARRLGLAEGAVIEPGACPPGFDLIAGPRTDAALCAAAQSCDVFAARWHPRALIAELRAYQWGKNLLLFLPALAAYDFSVQTLLAVFVAMIAFSAGASALYILNDLLDLAADRLHPEKRHRPLASGTLPIGVATRAGAALLLGAVALSAAVGWPVTACLLVYLGVSMVYSLILKRIRWIDLLALAAMFLLRVLTGGAAAQTLLHPALLGFVFFVFFTLACVKRLTGLARLDFSVHLPGRGYRKGDVAGVFRAGIAAAALALAAFLVYAFGPSAATIYGRPGLLALAVVPMGVWLVRLMRLARSGQEDYDPLWYVAHDRVGLAIAACGLVLVLMAIPG